jgi:hypothetical protein
MPIILINIFKKSFVCKLVSCLIILFVAFGCAGNSPLIIKAAGDGDINTVQQLQAEGQNLNEADSSGATPLMYAIWGGKVDLAKYLIESGADIKAKDSRGYDALSYAIDYKQFEIIKRLVDKGANLNSKDSSGKTSLARAVSYKNYELINTLLDKGADIESKDSLGRTPLFDAVLAVSNVTEANVFKRIASKANDITPRDEAVEVFKLLIKRNANVNAKDNESISVLEFALSCYNQTDVVNELVNAGANLLIPSDGKARLLFFGEEFFIKDSAWVTIGDISKYLAKDIKLTFIDVNPGKHTIVIPVSWYQKKVNADINVEAGQTYYLEITQNIDNRTAGMVGAVAGPVGYILSEKIVEQASGKGAFFIIQIEETVAKEKIKAILQKRK